MSKVIMGIQITERSSAVKDVQGLLSDYGCYIKTRLGLHEADLDTCSNKGLIILELIDKADREAAELEGRLKNIPGVAVQKMVF